MTQTQKQNVPKLRFPGFEEPWKSTRLADMGDTVSGLTYSPDDIRKEGLLVLRSSNVKDSKLVYDDCVFVRPDIKGANRVRENDILICVRNGSASLIGKNAVIPADIGDVAFGAFMTVFRPSADGFVHQLLRTDMYKKQVAADLGARINSINNSQLKKYRFNTPTLPEQRKIAGFLSAVDEKIAQLSRKKALLEDYKKGCMQQLFSQKIRFKDDDGNDFPEWEEKRLGEVANVYQPETLSQNQLDKDGKFLVYGANGIIGRLDRYNHENAQVAVTCRGNTCGRVTFTQPKSWITGNAMIVNLDDAPDVSKRFVYNLFLQTDWTYLITGSGQPQITGDIKKHKIKLPHPTEQRKIADFLSALDRKIDLVAQELTHARNFKAGLLQQMFV